MDKYLIIGDENHDAVKELCQQAWDAGQRDMLAKCMAALEPLMAAEIREQAIRDCIAAVEAQAKAGQGQAMPGSDWVHSASVLAALRSLLEEKP